MTATLVTGGTGFVGATLVSELLCRDEPDRRVVVLARGPQPRERVLAALRAVDDPPTDRLDVLPGDLTAPGLGLPGVPDVDTIVHCGASIQFDLPLQQAREINVGGTAMVLQLAQRTGARLVHVSTAFVSGRHDGTFGEDDLDLEVPFRNTYERTKAEAEALVLRSGVPAAIARPSIVVGESATGWTSAFNVLYWPLRAYTRGLLDALPADPDGVIDAIGVDAVVAGLLALHDDDAAAGTFALAAAANAVTVRELAQAASAAVGRSEPRFGPAQISDAADVYVPYFDVATRFDAPRGTALLGGPPPRLTEVLPRLLDFAERARWGKRPLSRAQARLAPAA